MRLGGLKQGQAKSAKAGKPAGTLLRQLQAVAATEMVHPRPPSNTFSFDFLGWRQTGGRLDLFLPPFLSGLKTDKGFGRVPAAQDDTPGPRLPTAPPAPSRPSARSTPPPVSSVLCVFSPWQISPASSS